jgi:hypothetical protein
MLFKLQAQEKTQQELEVEVQSRNKLLMSHPLEESTLLSIYLQAEQEKNPSRTTKLLLNAWLTRSSTVKRTMFRHALLSERRNKSKRMLRVIVDLYDVHLIIF